jgi:hypothetical protein
MVFQESASRASKTTLKNVCKMNKEKFGNLVLASGDIVTFDSETLETGRQIWLTDGANDWSQLPPGKYCTIDNQYFVVENGIVTSISGNQNQIIKKPAIQPQGYASNKTQMAKLNVDDLQAPGAGENAGTPKLIDKKSTKGTGAINLERMKRMAEVNASNQRVQNMTFRSDLNKSTGSNLTAAEQAKFTADRAYVEGRADKFGKQKFATVKDARLNPRFEFHMFTATTPEEMDREASEILNDIPTQKTEQKKAEITELDRQFAKAQQFFSSKKSSK